MADTAAPETTATPRARKPRPEGIKRVGADFTAYEYAKFRKTRFAMELDKDSDLLRAAVTEYFENHFPGA